MVTWWWLIDDWSRRTHRTSCSHRCWGRQITWISRLNGDRRWRIARSGRIARLRSIGWWLGNWWQIEPNRLAGCWWIACHFDAQETLLVIYLSCFHFLKQGVSIQNTLEFAVKNREPDEFSLNNKSTTGCLRRRLFDNTAKLESQFSNQVNINREDFTSIKQWRKGPPLTLRETRCQTHGTWEIRCAWHSMLRGWLQMMCASGAINQL